VGEAFFHRKSDIESADIITFPLSSGGKAERTVDVVSVSLDGQSKRVIWRVPGGAPSALALNDLHSSRSLVQRPVSIVNIGRDVVAVTFLILPLKIGIIRSG
jgi:hypothetical protein